MTPQMRKMLTLTSIVFGIIFGWLILKKIFFAFMMHRYTPPPVTISASHAVNKNWPLIATSVGTLKAVNGVDISTEIAGVVKNIYFVSGQFVKKDQLLISLDDNIEKAQLKSNEASLKLAELNYNRDVTLFKKNVISQSIKDADYAKYQQAQAEVEETKGKINQKNITAPFTGKLGINLVNLGEYLASGSQIVNLQALTPLYVQFNLPQEYVHQLAVNETVLLTVNASHAITARGKITAINSKVDETTRNILVEATIPNKDYKLYPGMFAEVQVILNENNTVLTVPITAISYSLHGNSVFIIKDESKNKKHSLLKAYRQYVKTGEERENDISILEGLKKDAEVITSGQVKLQNGTTVMINNDAES